jgi:dienelactone hydrolase
MEIDTIRYEGDGRSFTGYLADGSGGGRVPGILVAHEGPGPTEHVRERARMLAELGHVAFALDLYGEPGLSIERAKELVRALRADRAALRRRARAALDVLTSHPHVDSGRLAAIGYCFGGTAVLELARSGADLSCVVGFHPGLDATPQDASAVRGKVLVCAGEKDPVVTAEQRAAFAAEMSAAGVDWQLYLLGGAGHSFTNREIDAYGFPGFAYHAVADRRSWLAMQNLFDEVLAPRARAAAPEANRPGAAP